MLKSLLLLFLVSVTIPSFSQFVELAEGNDSKPVATQSAFVQGNRDAERYYSKYKAAGTGTLVASVISPLLGLIPAIACSSIEPQEANLGVPKPEMLTQGEYYLGYTQKAKKIKSRRVWTNWGVGLGVNLAIVLVAAASR
ncbi:hypothetical protein [Telluribacter sp.]|jgi:hypothetical protein|uniref:hypothetical protein n=1 Tax=Telluribacter sp. TaxID=1978767 RepID=UPI002E167F34|nr:hypothetical protein [Telluribacter sp.]